LAPTDAAFEALEAANPGILESLLANPEALRPILLYHVIAGRAPASAVIELNSAESVEGRPVLIERRGNALYVGGARVLITDVQADNGIIHVIDSVLLPPAEDIDEQDLVRGAQEIQGGFGITGKDVYRFSIEDDGHIAASLVESRNCPTNATMTIFAIEANGDMVEIARSSDDEETCPAVEVLLNPGDYALVVTGRDFSAVPNYILTTNLVTVIEGTGEYQGGFAQGGNDVFRFNLDATSIIRFQLSDGANGCPQNTALTLYQVRNGRAHEVLSDNNFGRRTCSVIQGRIHSGEYLLIATSRNNQAVPEYVLNASIR
jgi:hypothetical protein